MGCHAPLKGIFPTQESNPGLLHCRWILYRLSHQGSHVIVHCMAIRYQLMDIQVSFHFLAIMNKAVSICIQDFLWTLCFHFSWSGREWGHMVTVFNYLSSLQTVFQRNISTNVLLFLILISTVIILLFGHNYLWGYEVPSYCNLDLEFPGGL